MEKLKAFLMSINFNMAVFALLGLRIAAVGASIGDALVVIALCGLQAFYRWMDSKIELPLSDRVEQELKEIKSSMSGLVMKSSIKPQTGNQEMKKFF